MCVAAYESRWFIATGRAMQTIQPNTPTDPTHTRQPEDAGPTAGPTAEERDIYLVSLSQTL